MTSPTLTRRLADGRLQRLLPGVYVVAGSVPSWHQRLMGACVAAGPGAAASHRAAGRLWGLLQGEQPLEVTVPLRKAPRIRHVAVHRSTDLTPDQVTRRRRIPVTNPLRTVVDLGAVLDPDEVEEALDRGLVSGLFSIVAIEHLLDRLARCGRSGCGVLRRVLDDRALGDERPDGLLEARMARLLRDAGLAPAVFQYVVRNEAGRFVANRLRVPADPSGPRSRWVVVPRVAPRLSGRPGSPQPAHHRRMDGSPLHLARRRAPAIRRDRADRHLLCAMTLTP
jgi:hypothetical protein